MAGSDFTGKSGGGFLARVAKLVKTGADKATNWGTNMRLMLVM